MSFVSHAVVLGSGTSTGVPILGVKYEASFLANPKNHRTRPSLLVAGPEGNLLVDCTPDMRFQLLREGVYDVEAVLLTHAHADHIMGMDDLRSFCLARNRFMPVYAYPDAQAIVKQVFPYAFRESQPGVEVPRYELLPVPPVLEICGLRIETMTVMHGRMPVVAFRINDFAYVTDVSEIPEPAWEKLQKLDVLVLDAVRKRPHPNHFHFDKAIEVALQLNAKKTYFTHLGHDYNHDETNLELPDGIELAYDGLKIEI